MIEEVAEQSVVPCSMSADKQAGLKKSTPKS